MNFQLRTNSDEDRAWPRGHGGQLKNDPKRPCFCGFSYGRSTKVMSDRTFASPAGDDRWDHFCTPHQNSSEFIIDHMNHKSKFKCELIVHSRYKLRLPFFNVNVLNVGL